MQGVVVLDEARLHLTVGLLLCSKFLLVEKGQYIIHRQEQIHNSHTGTGNRLPRDTVSNLSIEDNFPYSP